MTLTGASIRAHRARRVTECIKQGVRNTEGLNKLNELNKLIQKQIIRLGLKFFGQNSDIFTI
jgi:hypothetical protein